MHVAGAIPVEGEAKLFTPGLTRRLVGVSLFAAVVYSIWLLYADFGALAQTLRDTSLNTVMLALGLSTLNYVFRWIRWQAYLNELGMTVPLLESVTVFNAGFAMTVTPAKIGEVLKSILLKRTHGVAIAVTAPIIIAERITDLAGLVLLAAFGCLAFDYGWFVAALGLVTVVALLGALSWRPLGELCLLICERLPFLARLSDRLRGAYTSLLRLNRPGLTLQATFMSTIAWATHCLALWLIAEQLSPGAIDMLESCVAYSAPLLGGTIVLIPGGLGATEATMTGALVAMSSQALTTSEATAIALIVRLVTFWWAIVVGAAALTFWRFRYGK